MIGVTRSTLLADVARQSGLAQEIARAQTQVSTQKRLQAGSDDPAAAARIAAIRRDQASRAAWSGNLDAAAATASRADTTLGSVANSLQQAVELMTQAANGTLNDADRGAIAAQLAGIVDDVTSAMAATDSNGQPLFPNGAATQIPVGSGKTLAATASRGAVFGDLLATLTGAARAVSSNSAIGAALDAVTAASTRIGDQRGLQGVRAAHIDSVKAALDAGDTGLAAERSGLEDTDLAATVAKLQSKLVTLEAAQAIFAQINKQTLFDKLS